MAAPMQKLARIACQCFSRKQQDTVFREQLNNLTSALNSITAKDVNFDPKSVTARSSETDAPVTYVHIWEDDIFTMGIFVVKPGGKLPMHDHPNMYGFCKVIHGSVHLKSYSVVSDQKIPEDVEKKLQLWQKPLVKSVSLRQDQILTTNDDCCFLTPSDGNIHEIQSAGGIAAFLDILAPPYNNNQSRDCHYYKELPVSSILGNKKVGSASIENSKPTTRWLMQVSQPHEYWCDTLDYLGPPIIV
ncbi:2-aminoethanethiol dioxygenase-like [Haliotis rufescens]|uniref:2-aminoethanethiol dioxygenase-like n=1 Tax=Haliotis rufescens TaxID=6454 RepID=UPI001EAFB5E2|nr:2-aminoethanethiol dioxygenase-like [Haliotis rufescens]